jgi:hypothetical protein
MLVAPRRSRRAPFDARCELKLSKGGHFGAELVRVAAIAIQRGGDLAASAEWSSTVAALL